MVNDLAKRFEEKFIPEPNSGCWLWTATVGKLGYGVVSNFYKRESSHRVAWKLYKGEIPPNMCVCHVCDVRSCVNPDHLFLGTQGDNNKDMKRKGRLINPRGERHGSAKVTENAVRDIRSARMSVKEFAKMYGLSRSQVQLIMSGKRVWRHVN